MAGKPAGIPEKIQWNQPDKHALMHASAGATAPLVVSFDDTRGAGLTRSTRLNPCFI